MSNLSIAMVGPEQQQQREKPADEIPEAMVGNPSCERSSPSPSLSPSLSSPSSSSETRHKTAAIDSKNDGGTTTAPSSPAASQATPPRRVTHVRQLFVGNLPFRVRWQDVKDLFRKAGNVARADVALTFDNRSKGHGTVLFATVEDAQKAIDMLHNYKWQGRVLEVREDRGFVEPAQRQLHQAYSPENARHPATMFQAPLMDGFGRMDGAPEVVGGRQLFVGNLPFQCQWQDVKDLFRNAGNILRADVVQDQDGRSRGFGTVLYATHEDAKKAIAMYNGFEFRGRQLRVHFDKFAPGPTMVHHHHRPVPPSLPHMSSAYGMPPMRPHHHPMFDDISQPYLPPLPLPHYAFPFSMDLSQAAAVPPPPGSMHLPPPPPPLPHPVPPFADAADQLQQSFGSFSSEGPTLLLRQFPGSPTILESHQNHQHQQHDGADTMHPPHEYRLPPDPFHGGQNLFPGETPMSFADDAQMAMLASSTLGPIGISFADAPVFSGVVPAMVNGNPGLATDNNQATTTLFGMTSAYSPWGAGAAGGPSTASTQQQQQQQQQLGSERVPEPTEETGGGSYFSSPRPATSPDDNSNSNSNLVEAMGAISLTDGSAGLTATSSARTPTKGKNNENHQHHGLTPTPPPPPTNHLLSSNSVWEPLGGFKY